jgi:small-conductance mechanosensitive channel
MTVATNAAEALDKGVGTVESIADWFIANRADLPIGLAVAAAIVAVMLGLRWVGGRMLAGDPDCERWRGVIGRVLCRTTLYFMVATALSIVVSYAEVPSRLDRLVQIFFIVASSLQAAIWARELVLGVIGRRVASDNETTLGNAMSIIRVLVSVALFAVATVVILDNLGVNVTALVAGLGIGGIAIGLAAQGIFSDLFAALAIIFDRPFRRGDTIQYGTTIGTVEAIGLKTTRLRALSGEQVVMANTKLLEQEVRNLRLIKQRRVTLILPLAPSTSADQLAAVPDLLRDIVEAQKSTRFDHAWLLGRTGNSIDVELIYFMTKPDAELMAATRHTVLIEATRALQARGIGFTDLTPPRG